MQTETKKLTGIELISEERQRQIEKEGYNLSHDIKHDNFELTKAAIAYLDTSEDYVDEGVFCNNKMPSKWEFKTETEDWTFGRAYEMITEPHRYNPSIRDLVKAGALIAAEIDRLNNQ